MIGGNKLDWRKDARSLFEEADANILLIDPLLCAKSGLSTEEYSIWNKQQIYNCDIVLFNLNDITEADFYSLGMIDAINSFCDKYIFVVGFQNSNRSIPTYHTAKNLEDAIDYVISLSGMVMGIHQ